MINFRSSQTGQNQRLFAGDQMRAIEFGRNVHRQTASPQSLGGVFRVGSGGKKVSAQREKDALSSAFVHRLNCVHRVVTVTARWFEIEFSSELVEKGVGRPFPDSHRAIALNVAVTADRTKPAPGFPICPRSNIRFTIS